MSKRHRLDVDEDSLNNNTTNNKGLIKAVFSTVKRLIPWLHGNEDSIAPRPKRPRLESSPIPGHLPTTSAEIDDLIDEPSAINVQTPPQNNFGHSGTVLESPSSFLFHKQNNVEAHKPPSSSHHLPLNGDDHSENSDGSASTSGCSSFISSSHLPPTLQEPSKTFSFNNNQAKVDASVSTDSTLISATFADLTESLRRRPLWSERRPSLNRKPQPVVPSSSRPTFNAALLGPAHLPVKSPLPPSSKSCTYSKFSSPFYEGTTSFGGSSATKRQKNSFSETPYVRPVHVQVNPPQSDNSIYLSTTAKKILQSIESTGPSVTESSSSFASTTPFSIDTSKYRKNISSRESKFTKKQAISSPPPVASTPLPSHTKTTFTLEPLVPKKLPPKENTTPQSKKLITSPTTNNAASSSSTEKKETEKSLNSKESKSDSHSLSYFSSGSSGGAGGKMKTKVCPPHHATVSKQDNEIVEEVKLPNVSLPLTSLPTFSFNKMSSSPQNNKDKKDHLPLPDSNDKIITSTPISKVTNKAVAKATSCDPSFTFSSPIPLSTAASASPTSNQPTHFTFNFSQPLIKTSTAVSGFGSQFRPPPGSWECQVCLVRNKSQDTSCASCSSPKSETIPSTSSSSSSSFGNQFTPAPGSWQCTTCLVRNKKEDTACAACSSAKPGSAPPSSGFGNQFTPTPGSWQCTTCLVRNKKEDTACAACTSAKPGSAPPSSEGKKDESSKPPLCSKCHTSPPFFGSDQCSNCQKPQSTAGFGDKFKPPAGSWACDTCFVQNSGSTVKCIACETRRPGTFETKKNVSSSIGFKFGTNNFKFGVPSSPMVSSQSQEVTSFANESGNFPFGQQPSSEAKTKKSLPSNNFGGASSESLTSSSDSEKTKSFGKSTLDSKDTSNEKSQISKKSDIIAESSFIKKKDEKNENSDSQLNQDKIQTTLNEAGFSKQPEKNIFSSEKVTTNTDDSFISKESVNKTFIFNKDSSKTPNAELFTFGTPKSVDLTKDSSSSFKFESSFAKDGTKQNKLFSFGSGESNNVPKNNDSQEPQTRLITLGSGATKDFSKNKSFTISSNNIENDKSSKEIKTTTDSANPLFKFGILPSNQNESAKDSVSEQPLESPKKLEADVPKDNVFSSPSPKQTFNFGVASSKDLPASSQPVKFGTSSSTHISKESSSQTFQFGFNASKSTPLKFAAPDPVKESHAATNSQASQDAMFKFSSESTAKEAKSFIFDGSSSKLSEKPPGSSLNFSAENVTSSSAPFVFGSKDPSTTSFGLASTTENKPLFTFGAPSTSASTSAPMFKFGESSTTVSQGGFGSVKMLQQGPSTVDPASQQQQPLFKFGSGGQPTQQTQSTTTPFKFGSGEQTTQQMQSATTPFKFGSGEQSSQPLQSTGTPFKFGSGEQSTQLQTTTTPFKFGSGEQASQPLQSTATTPFKFGSGEQSSQPVQSATTPFKFGSGEQASQPLQTTATPFKFGSGEQTTQQLQSTATPFKFGSGEQTTQQLQSTTTFKFGVGEQTSQQPQPFKFGAPAAEPFVFGATAPQQPAVPSGGFNFSPFVGNAGNPTPTVNFGSMVSPSPAQMPSFGQPLSAVDSQSLPPVASSAPTLAVPPSFNFSSQGASTPGAPFQFAASGPSGGPSTTRRIKKAVRKVQRGP